MSNGKQTVLVFSNSGEIRDSIKVILNDDYEIIESKNIAQALASIDKNKPKVCITDFASVTLNGENAVEHIASEHPETILLLTCPSEKRDDLLATKLSNQTFRVLFSPLSPGQTKLAVAAAFKHSDTRSDTDAASSVSNSTKKSSSKLIPILAIAGVGALAAIAWLSSSTSEKQQKLQIEQAQVSQEISREEEIQQLLLTAQAALNANNRFPPEGINALESFLKVLALDPNNSKAKDAIDTLSHEALGDFDLHFSNGSADEAIASVGAARDIAAYNEGFAEKVESVLEQKRINYLDNIKTDVANNNVSDAANTMNTYVEIFSADDDEIYDLEDLIEEKQSTLDRQAEINTLVSNTTDALSRNRLLTPNQNNARYFINRLENIDPNHPSLIDVKKELATLLLVEADKTKAVNDFTGSRRYLDAAASVGADSNLIATEKADLAQAEVAYKEALLAAESDAQAEIEAARVAQEEQDKRNAEQAEAARLAEEQRVAEEKQEALETLLATPVSVPLSGLTFTKRTAPEYPRRYEQRGTTGAASIDFTVNKNGLTSDVSVSSVEPASATAFGTAAQKAVEEWTFEPYEDDDGNIRTATSKIRIVFQ